MDGESATASDIDPETAIWAKRLKTNMILADIYDMLAMINANIVGAASQQRARNPRPYPRPGNANKDTKRIGSEGLPPDELEAWMNMKREKHGRKHD